MDTNNNHISHHNNERLYGYLQESYFYRLRYLCLSDILFVVSTPADSFLPHIHTILNIHSWKSYP